MREERRKPDWPILVAIIAALVLVPCASYLGGYFWLAKVEDGFWVPEQSRVIYRTFGAKWKTRIFEPAGKVEEFLAGYDVEIGHEGLHSYP